MRNIGMDAEHGINLAWSQRSARRMRIVNASLAAAMLCLAAFSIATGQMVWLAIGLLGFCANAGTVTFQTWLIRRAREDVSGA